MNTTEPVTIHNATKLYQLLELAINDAEALQNDPRYKLDMGAWHDGIHPRNVDNACHVCMAGAVMARQLNATITDNVTPGCYDADINNKLAAINHLRRGNVYIAYRRLYSEDIPPGENSRELEPLCLAADEDSMNPQYTGFKAHKALAAKLKELDI